MVGTNGGTERRCRRCGSGIDDLGIGALADERQDHRVVVARGGVVQDGVALGVFPGWVVSSENAA
jgi:hypothetical protein